MGLVNKIIPHYTYDDWIHWEGRWELIDGHPIAMSRAPMPEHQRVGAVIITELTIALRQNNCRKCRAYGPIDYKISEDTILQPDVLIVCGNIIKPFLDFPPALVVEILSPSTALRDRHTKYELNEQQGVLYYLIVDIEIKKPEVYRLHNGRYQLQATGVSYSFALDEGCTIMPELNMLFT